METRANHIWVGTVTLALLAGLAAFFLWLAHLGEGNKQVFDIFFHQSVDGLSKGTSVSYAGVPAGQIAEIELWKKDPSFVRVRIHVSPKIPIYQGTTATIQGSFTGGSTILLNGGLKGAKEISEIGPEGASVIPTKRGGLGELLANAPLLLDRLATLSERLTQLLSDENQKSFTHILANTDRMTSNLADASPEVKRTLVELQTTMADARLALASFQKLAATADRALDPNAPSVVKSVDDAAKSVRLAADALQATLGDLRPATQQLGQTTLPAAEAAIRDLRAATRALRDITEKVDNQGAGSLLGGSKLPEYKP
jgi:phospholipid/cholesterol/gamma-HCH transport system substrate-binding protein